MDDLELSIDSNIPKSMNKNQILNVMMKIQSEINWIGLSTFSVALVLIGRSKKIL